jgi:hypothetical protein
MIFDHGPDLSAEQCLGRPVFRLSDESGSLRFMEFEILNAPECRDMEATLRDYFVGRALADVDLEFLRGLHCPGDGACLDVVIREVRKHQRLFVRNRAARSATC